MFKQYEVHNDFTDDYFEEYTTQKEASKAIKDIKWEGIIPADTSVYVKYTDGTEITLFDCDDPAELKTSNIKQMIIEADYGETFYNAFPELDIYNENDRSLDMIRIASYPGEYGKAYDLKPYLV